MCGLFHLWGARADPNSVEDMISKESFENIPLPMDLPGVEFVK